MHVMLEASVLRVLEASPDGLTEKEVFEKISPAARPEEAIGQSEISAALKSLVSAGAVEERMVGAITTYYPLTLSGLKRVLIVEDDANINRLMRLSIGKGFEIREVFDGSGALSEIDSFKPHLILLDLMLPGVNGLEICRRVKESPSLRETVVIIVSAADAVKNRFAGIKLGADYYIKKPFKPRELRSLVNLFLKKKGRRFDPLVDLPDEARLSRELEARLGASDFELSLLKVENLASFSQQFGSESASTVVRLVSQILQEKAGELKGGFIGFIGGGEFVIGGSRNESTVIASEVCAEFDQVLPFIYQEKAGALDLGIAELFNAAEEVENRLALSSTVIANEKILSNRSALLAQKSLPPDLPPGSREIGFYSYEELKKLVGSGVDVALERDENGVKLRISKRSGKAD